MFVFVAAGGAGVSHGRRRLALLSGREKLKDGRGREGAIVEYSELIDGDRGIAGMYGDMGECGIDVPLLEESLRGCEEKVEPALELV